MVNKSVEKAIALFMLFGVPIATIFIMAEPLPFAIPVTDPVNTPQALCLWCSRYWVICNCYYLRRASHVADIEMGCTQLYRFYYLYDFSSRF